MTRRGFVTLSAARPSLACAALHLRSVPTVSGKLACAARKSLNKLVPEQ
jgi:hypothetical protein